MNSPERIQKVLARAGLASRREVERWISEGRIRINGRTATPGDHISPGDRVRVDGKPVRLAAPASRRPRMLAYHKPVGEVCSRNDEKGRSTVFEKLPVIKAGRWINIGRLDINTSGLLLFTNHGELANRLMHPSYEIEREYAVRVFGEVDQAILSKLLHGVELEDGPARFTEITDAGGRGANHWYHVVIREGRNREIRRLWESQGITVSRLIRVRYGSCTLPRSLRSGRSMELEKAQVDQFTALVGLSQTQSPPPRRLPKHAR